MKNLYQGIYTMLQPRLEGIDLHAGYALQETFPYVTFTVGEAAELEYVSKNTGCDVYPVTFSVFHTDFDRVSEIMDLIFKAFEKNVLVIPDASFISAYRTAKSIEIDPDQAETGESVWHGIVIEEIEIQEDRT